MKAHAHAAQFVWTLSVCLSVCLSVWTLDLVCLDPVCLDPVWLDLVCLQEVCLDPARPSETPRKHSKT